MPVSVFFWSWCFCEVHSTPGAVQRGHSYMWRGTWEKVAWHSSGNYFQMTFQNCSSIPPHPSCGISWVTMTMLIHLSPFQAEHHRLSKAHMTRHVGIEKLCSSSPFANVSQETIWLFGVNIFFARIIKKNPIFPTSFYVCSMNFLFFWTTVSFLQIAFCDLKIMLCKCEAECRCISQSQDCEVCVEPLGSLVRVIS